MSIRTKLTLVTLSGLIAIYAIVGGMLSSTSFGHVMANSGPYPQLSIFSEVVRHIVTDYVEKPDLNKVRIGALRGLTDALDPYSAYLLPQQVKEYQAKTQTDATGLMLGSIRGYAYVISVVPNSPAAKAGVKARDFIEYIDGHATHDIDLVDAYSLLSGAPGTQVEVAYLRSGARGSEKVKITRGSVTAPKPELQALEQQIGYVKVQSLPGQSEAVQASIREAIKRGANKIILDLRGSAGDDLQAGVEVANYFLKSGTIAKVIGRKEKVIMTYEAKPEKTLTDLPLAIITDYSTAGAAEIVAAAILDNKRGEVIGERTFGIGSEQKLFPIDDGSAFLLTVARYASPNGKFFLPEGVTPSVEVKRKDVADASALDELDPDASPAPSTTPNPSDKDKATKPVTQAAPQKPAEDLLLKKAIEVLTTANKAKKKAA